MKINIASDLHLETYDWIPKFSPRKASNMFSGLFSCDLLNPSLSGPCKIHYHDIGDYLSREQKLKILSKKASIDSVPWTVILPNKSGDWINPRSEDYQTLVPLGNKDDRKKKPVFDLYSQGVKTNRDNWIYSFSKERLIKNIRAMINFYNQQVRDFAAKGLKKSASVKDLESFIDTDSRKISWTRALKQDLLKGKEHPYAENAIVLGLYRPFCKQWMYFDRNFNEVIYQILRIFPKLDLENKVISVMGIGANKEFSVLMTDFLPDYELVSKGQCFPLYRYEQAQSSGIERFIKGDERTETGFQRLDTISDQALEDFRSVASSDITKEDIFYYVYGILHSPDFRAEYKSDLSKSLPRVPKPLGPGMFWAFSDAGKDLAHLHLNYESIDPWPLEEKTNGMIVRMLSKEFYRIEKMRFGKGSDGKPDKTTIVYNSHLTLSKIPIESYEYIVNGKSAIEWILDRYQVTVNKDSGMKNDPNEWSEDPRYILDLLKRVVRVSIETVKIINELPSWEEKEPKKGYRIVFTGGESIAAEDES